MLFSSNEFLFVFLPLAWIAWRAAAAIDDRLALLTLTAASLAFYAYDGWRSLHLLLFASLLGYLYQARWVRLETPLPLVASVAALLGVLFYYKYLGFVGDTLAVAGVISPGAIVAPVLPIGISFFTLEVIGSIVDARRNVGSRKQNYGSFLLFVSYFPHLIAGPIIRFNQLSGQLSTRRMVDAIDIPRGLMLIGMGLFMKVGLADRLASFVDQVFAAPTAATMGAVWLAIGSYALQIYFDFNGYCTMAVGLSLLFGIILPFNFESPYRATSIIEFWRRWNVTLSQFLRDYLYQPLGGRGSSVARWMTNLFVTMLASGIWHGAGWNFVIWGMMHGIALMVAHGVRTIGVVVPAWIGWMLTLTFVVFAWIPFRATSLGNAQQMLGCLAGCGGDHVQTGVTPIVLFVAALAALIVLVAPNSKTICEQVRFALPTAMAAGAVLGVALMIQLYAGQTYQFIYFRF
jgi:D-alanyl-lipoteichoic acid acyltransferase DltB (MBOAT superfamily)